MSSNSRSVRNRRSDSPHQVNLVSARSRSNNEARKLSRSNSADGYALLRKKRVRKRNLLLGFGVLLTSLFVAAIAGLGVYALIINNNLHTDLSGNKNDFNTGVFENVFVEPETAEAPFWILLLGTDDRYGDSEYDYPRTDTMILVRVDQPNKTVAMISIPRDTYVNIPGYGMDKINAAYSLGEQEQAGAGVALAIQTVSEFAGIDIAYFAQVNFDGLVALVDDLGGVVVDVPVDIIGDYDAGSLDIYAGLQSLDGEAALVFCRSREFGIGDYQRQANQRTFLQALASQVLASDPGTIATTVTNIANMTYTNMDITKIVKIAQSMHGMRENAIHTYHVPSVTDDSTGTSYVVADSYSWRQLVEEIESGSYPPPQDDSYSGVVPDDYVALSSTAQDNLGGKTTNVTTSEYVVDVRNGNGIAGSARSVSDMLSIAGYIDGEIGNTNAYIYPTTLIIYNDTAARSAAEDIRQRLGYGRIIASNGAYEFSGDVLVVVGDDFKG